MRHVFISLGPDERHQAHDVDVLGGLQEVFVTIKFGFGERREAASKHAMRASRKRLEMDATGRGLMWQGLRYGRKALEPCTYAIVVSCPQAFVYAETKFLCYLPQLHQIS
jgi:hypothetical protein